MIRERCSRSYAMPGHSRAGDRHRARAHDRKPDTVDARGRSGLHDRSRPRHAPRRAGAAEQQVEVPAHSDWGRFANHFGTAHKAFFITADTMTYDFGRIAPIDFAFIDGGHDMEHVLNDSRKTYEILSPGGLIVWHDFNSPVPWVKVREAIERMGFAEPVVHVQGTEVAFLRKGDGGGGGKWRVAGGEKCSGRVARAELAMPQEDGHGPRRWGIEDSAPGSR